MEIQDLFSQIIQVSYLWKDVKINQISIQKLTGITNVTYKISYIGKNQQVQPKDFILRNFGSIAVNTFIDLQQEEKVYELCKNNGFGPQIYYKTPTVRMEEYFHSTIMDPNNMSNPIYYRKIAQKLANFHKQDTLDLDKNHLFYKIFTHQNPILKNTIQKANENLFTEFEQLKLKKILEIVDQSEIDFLQSFFPQNQKMYVFSHNDLLANNILIQDKTENILFIDFEYSCYNILSFDIANYFNESQYDYNLQVSPYFIEKKENLDMEKILDFVINYSQEALRLNPKDHNYNNNKDLRTLIDSIMKIIPIGICLSHYFWILWAIFMSKNSEVQFDYIEFAYSRYLKYIECKKLLRM